jgi:hypothetical protein
MQAFLLHLESKRKEWLVFTGLRSMKIIRSLAIILLAVNSRQQIAGYHLTGIYYLNDF